MPRSKFCPQCGYLRAGAAKQIVMHYRICVPKRQWPDELRAYIDHPIQIQIATPYSAPAIARPGAPIENLHARERAVVARTHTELHACDCGFVAASNTGLIRHRQQARVHGGAGGWGRRLPEDTPSAALIAAFTTREMTDEPR